MANVEDCEGRWCESSRRPERASSLAVERTLRLGGGEDEFSGAYQEKGRSGEAQVPYGFRVKGEVTENTYIRKSLSVRGSRGGRGTGKRNRVWTSLREKEGTDRWISLSGET